MPKISIIFTLLFVLFLKLSGSTQYFSEFENYNDDIRFNNHYLYENKFSDNNNFIFKGDFSVQKNSAFKRKGKNSKLFWKYQLNKFSTNFSLISSYELNYDTGKPDNRYYKIENVSKNIGININKDLLKYISTNTQISFLNQNKDNSSYGYHVEDNGFNLENNVSFYKTNNGNQIKSSYQYNLRKIRLNDYKNQKFSFDWEYRLANNYIHPIINYLGTNSSLYDFDKKNDTQVFIKKQAYLNYKYFNEKLPLFSFSTEYLTKTNSYKSKNTKNYFEKEIDYDASFKIPLHKNILSFNLNRNFDDKKYSHSPNTLNIDYRKFSSSFILHISERDSIVFSSEISLKKNNYPDENNSLDNDLQEKIFSVLLNYYPNNFINFKNTFRQTNSHQVYLFSSMSGNSDKKITYNIIPKISLLFSPVFSIVQSYNLRIDYDKYDWNISGNDRYFRKFSAEYSFLYNNKPLVYERHYLWNRVSYKKINQNYTDFKLIYKYDTNNSGQKTISDTYNSLATNKTQTCTIDFSKNINKINFRIRPKISWSKEREMNQLFSLSYNFNENNKSEIMINPLYVHHKKTIWKIIYHFDYSF